jgi:hypothetical protein
MGTVQRGVVKGSNKEGKGGDDRANGYLPLGGGGSPISPNEMKDGDRRANGSGSLTGGAPMVKPPDHRFNVSQAQMPQPPSAVEPGKGAIPVNPFLPGGSPAMIGVPVADMAPPRKG